MSEAELFAYFVPPLVLVLIGWAAAAWHMHEVRKEAEADRVKEEKDSPSFPGFFTVDRTVYTLSPRVRALFRRKWRVAPPPAAKRPVNTVSRH